MRPSLTGGSAASLSSALAGTGGWPETLSMLDRTFVADAADGGHFELGGRPIRLALEPEGWLVGWTRLGGAADRWLARQSRMPTAAKIVEGPALRVDVPVGDSPAGAGALGHAFTTLKGMLRDALASLAGVGASTAGGASAMSAAERAAAETLGAYVSSSPWPTSSEAGVFTLLVETARGGQRISAQVVEGRLRVAAPLARRPGEAVSRRAIGHFLLALNERMRLVRGAVGDAGVLVEVVLPAWSVSSDLVDRAVGALIVASAMAKRECAALLDPAVADAFCAFHRVGASSREAAADALIRAPHEERRSP